MSQQIPRAQKLATAKTELPPCALRYHPTDPSLIFLGTYKLEESDKSRHGSIDIYKYLDDTLTLVSSHPTSSAILDLKFCPFDPTLIYTGHSTGDLRAWRYTNSDSTLTPLHSQVLFEGDDVLVTSIIPSQIHRNRLLVTTTDGYASLVDLTPTGFSDPIFFETPHDLQCWTGAFGNFAELSDVVFTGGDDGCLTAHDTRTPSDMPIFQSKRIHEAGVVAIQTAQPGNALGMGDWFVDKPYTLWTGAYDDCLRTLDLRVVPGMGLIQGMVPRVKQKQKLGGGVWRFSPSVKQGDNKLLTCCMYDGARIVGANEDDEPVVERYFKEDHESMVYGCDWSPEGNKVATCSFYDGVVHVWSPEVTI